MVIQFCTFPRWWSHFCRLGEHWTLFLLNPPLVWPQLFELSLKSFCAHCRPASSRWSPLAQGEKMEHHNILSKFSENQFWISKALSHPIPSTRYVWQCYQSLGERRGTLACTVLGKGEAEVFREKDTHTHNGCLQKVKQVRTPVVW